ncbi:MAG: endo-1,4-beta-xylanase [Methylacidiphilales bacterium]|nr:endo-1,4-beta-xylanase [Candidatus Methylacidiphilales bacterium]
MFKKITRRNFIWFSLGFVAAVGTTKVTLNYHSKQKILALDNPTKDFTVIGTSSLKERAAAKGLMYGTAIRNHHLWEDSKLAETLVKECQILVPEWALKWYIPNPALRPEPNIFDFSEVDKILAFAQNKGLQLRGHTLVWHESLPPWFQDTVNSNNAQQILEQHINTVVGRYAGKMHSWDVVNEAINEGYLLVREQKNNIPNNLKNNLRKTPWLELLGDNYIDKAFRLTHQADPTATLVYNDYGLDYDTDADEAKRNAVLNLLENLKSKGTPIHALGIQAHLDASETNFNPDKLRSFLRDVASLGLKIMITELDVTDEKLPSDIEMRDRIIAKTYEDYLSTVLSEPAVTTVITWGISDKYSWLSDFKPRPDKAAVRPLPFDANMNRKLGWNAIARAFDNARLRS